MSSDNKWGKALDENKNISVTRQHGFNAGIPLLLPPASYEETKVYAKDGKTLITSATGKSVAEADRNAVSALEEINRKK